MSAVWSTTAGGLPGPAVIAFLGVRNASATTAGPPVTSSTRTSGWCISSRADSSVGAGIAVIRLGGPPAPTIARSSSFTFSTDTWRAPGWTLNVTALPAEMIAIALLMIVDVGLVVGVIDPMTPYGANSVTIMPRSPVTTCGSRSSGPGVRVVTSRFLRTLSSARPSPVSAWARYASRSPSRSIAARIASTIVRRASSPRPRKASNAVRAAPTAASIDGWIPSPRSASSAAS